MGYDAQRQKDRKIMYINSIHRSIFREKINITGTTTTTKLIKIFQKSLPQGNEKQTLQGDIDRKGEKWTFQ